MWYGTAEKAITVRGIIDQLQRRSSECRRKGEEQFSLKRLVFAGVASDSDRDGGLRLEGYLTRRGHDVVGRGA